MRTALRFVIQGLANLLSFLLIVPPTSAVAGQFSFEESRKVTVLKMKILLPGQKRAQGWVVHCGCSAMEEPDQGGQVAVLPAKSISRKHLSIMILP